jgi:hypothetical protein
MFTNGSTAIECGGGEKTALAGVAGVAPRGAAAFWWDTHRRSDANAKRPNPIADATMIPIFFGERADTAGRGL